jgi:hypothetical protein
MKGIRIAEQKELIGRNKDRLDEIGPEKKAVEVVMLT